MPFPKDQAREKIDRMLSAAGWEVRNLSDTNISASRGLAIRNFPLKSGRAQVKKLKTPARKDFKK